MTQPQQSADLAVLRQQIDSLDKQLLQLVNQRAHVAEQVGELKRKEGSAFFRPDRVAQVIQNIEKANPGPLYLYSAERARANLGRVRTALAATGRPSRVYYAMKANRFEPLLRAMAAVVLSVFAPRVATLVMFSTASLSRCRSADSATCSGICVGREVG